MGARLEDGPGSEESGWEGVWEGDEEEGALPGGQGVTACRVGGVLGNACPSPFSGILPQALTILHALACLGRDRCHCGYSSPLPHKCESHLHEEPARWGVGGAQQVVAPVGGGEQQVWTQARPTGDIR